MKNNEQKPTNSLFQPVNLDQQDSVVGGRMVREYIAEQLDSQYARIVARYEETAAKALKPGWVPCGRFLCPNDFLAPEEEVR